MSIRKNKTTSKFEGKENIELNFPGDGRTFLNFWDWAHGNDVVCQIKKNKLMLSRHDKDGKELPEKEITFPEFLKLVKESIAKRTV